MDSLRPPYRFKINIPEAIFFESNEPQTGIGKYGQWFRHEVMIDGRDYVLFASKGLQDRLSKLGNLYGRTLEITKQEDANNRIVWEIKENGTVITPGVSAEETSAAGRTDAGQENLYDQARIAVLERRLNTASSVVRELIDRVQGLEQEMENIKERTGAHPDMASRDDSSR